MRSDQQPDEFVHTFSAPKWEGRRSNTDEAETLIDKWLRVWKGLDEYMDDSDTSAAYNAEANKLLDQRELAKNLARQAAILCATGLEAANQRIQALALASIALSLAWRDQP